MEMPLKRQRLRHLMANAILELWKKETGSVASVLIEGTICITAGSGKTTIVQVSDQFNSSFPEMDVQSPHRGLNHSLSRVTPHKLMAPELQLQQQTPVSSRVDFRNQLAAYYGSFPTPSLVSPGNLSSRSSSVTEKQSPSPQKQHEDRAAEIKEEMGSEKGDDEEEEDDTEIVSKTTGSGGVIAGTGFYTCGSPDENGNNFKNNLNFSKNESGLGDSIICTPESTPNARPESAPISSEHAKTSTPVLPQTRDLDALDLTRVKDNDLAISSPQSYTAQVRDVIRQRLLAAKGTALSEEADRDTPNMLKSLGLHRSSSGEDEPPEKMMKPIDGSVNLAHTAITTVVNRANLQQHINGSLHEILQRRPQMTPPPLIRPGSFAGFHGGLPTMIQPQSALSQMSASIMQIGRSNSIDDDDASSGKASPSSLNGGQKIYSCEFCSKTFLFKSKYHEHLPVHTNARPFQCHLCSRTYKYKYDLRVHLRTHMGIPTKSTICPFCNVKFESNKLLRSHIKDAHKDKQIASKEECTQILDNLPPAL